MGPPDLGPASSPVPHRRDCSHCPHRHTPAPCRNTSSTPPDPCPRTSAHPLPDCPPEQTNPSHPPNGTPRTRPTPSAHLHRHPASVHSSAPPLDRSPSHPAPPTHSAASMDRSDLGPASSPAPHRRDCSRYPHHPPPPPCRNTSSTPPDPCPQKTSPTPPPPSQTSRSSLRNGIPRSRSNRSTPPRRHPASARSS